VRVCNDRFHIDSCSCSAHCKTRIGHCARHRSLAVWSIGIYQYTTTTRNIPVTHVVLSWSPVHCIHECLLGRSMLRAATVLLSHMSRAIGGESCLEVRRFNVGDMQIRIPKIALRMLYVHRQSSRRRCKCGTPAARSAAWRQRADQMTVALAWVPHVGRRASPPSVTPSPDRWFEIRSFQHFRAHSRTLTRPYGHCDRLPTRRSTIYECSRTGNGGGSEEAQHSNRERDLR
jgi:hypothetical protein